MKRSEIEALRRAVEETTALQNKIGETKAAKVKAVVLADVLGNGDDLLPLSQVIEVVGLRRAVAATALDSLQQKADIALRAEAELYRNHFSELEANMAQLPEARKLYTDGLIELEALSPYVVLADLAGTIQARNPYNLSAVSEPEEETTQPDAPAIEVPGKKAKPPITFTYGDFQLMGCPGAIVEILLAHPGLTAKEIFEMSETFEVTALGGNPYPMTRDNVGAALSGYGLYFERTEVLGQRSGVWSVRQDNLKKK